MLVTKLNSLYNNFDLKEKWEECKKICNRNYDINVLGAKLEQHDFLNSYSTLDYKSKIELK
jgi:hypothetical protein